MLETFLKFHTQVHGSEKRLGLEADIFLPAHLGLSSLGALRYRILCWELLGLGSEDQVSRPLGSATIYLVTSVVSNSVTLWTVACQAPLSMGFCRQEYWSGLPCPPPGDLPNPRIEPMSLMSPALASRFFTTRTTREATCGPRLILFLLQP